MFTGIIEAVGHVVAVRPDRGTREITIEAPPEILEDVRPGDSIAIDGACLTPVHVESGAFIVDAVGTTLSRTVVGDYVEGRRVNLERSLVMGGRIDGHFVQGHIDGIGHLESIREKGRYRLVRTSVPGEVYAATILHGSIALNGVSLTVNRLSADARVEVAIIPHTWSTTNFQYLSPGDPLNVEGDLIGKYVARLLRSEGTPHEAETGTDPEEID